MNTRNRKRSNTISPDEAIRAIYVDFEGGQKLDPTFIGVRTREAETDIFEQVLLEDGLFPTLDLPNGKHYGWPNGYTRVESARLDRVKPQRKASTMGALVGALVQQAKADDRRIVSWSAYEKDRILASDLVKEDVKEQFVELWRDAKPTAKAWKRKRHPNVVFTVMPGQGRHRLDHYLRLIDYRLPSYFGNRQAAQRIAFVRNQLGTKRSALDLTPVAKAKWAKVLDYNWHDCNGLREVTIRAAEDL